MKAELDESKTKYSTAFKLINLAKLGTAQPQIVLRYFGPSGFCALSWN
jgi:hypothetical protein